MKRKSLLITGSRNTAFAIAERMASEGWSIHMTSRSLDAAKSAAERLRGKYPGASVYAYRLDQSDVSDIVRLFAELRENTPTLDGFVANAAELGVGLDVYSATVENFDRIMNTNLRGTFFCAREAGRMMTEHGGSIVMLGSVQGRGAVEGRTLYSISKAAVSAMAKFLAFDLAPYSIRVNCLTAGAIHTERWDGQPEELTASRRLNYPLGRESDMAEIAGGVRYFLSDESKSTTGADLVIDSGVLLPILPYRDRKSLRHEDY